MHATDATRVRVLLAGTYGSSSGIDVYTDKLARGLASAGHEVIVADRSGRPGPAALPPVRGRIRKLGGALEGVLAHAALRTLAREQHADVVHATHLDLAASGGPPLVVTAWDPVVGVLARARAAPARGDAWFEELRYALADRRACRRAAGIVAISPAVLRALGGRHAVMLPAFLLDEEIAEPPASRSTGCVMIANGLDAPRKGLALAVEAIGLARARIPDLTLTLVGDWVDPGTIAGLPSFCRATGRLDRAGTDAVLHGAGCCVLPSLWEEFGFTGLEALAAGTPLVCGPLPGFSGLDSSGVTVVPDRDPHGFAAAICEAVRAPAADFPAQCRATSVIPPLVELYAAVA